MPGKEMAKELSFQAKPKRKKKSVRSFGVAVTYEVRQRARDSEPVLSD